MHGRTTDVEFTRGVVQCLKARGHTKITIAEGCGISHKHWENVARLTGYDAMAREEGVALVALDDDGVFDVEGDQPGKPLPISGIGQTHVPTLLLPEGARRAPRPRPLPLAAQDQGAPLRGGLARDQGHAGHR